MKVFLHTVCSMNYVISFSSAYGAHDDFMDLGNFWLVAETGANTKVHSRLYHAYVAEEIIEDTMITVHVPSVGHLLFLEHSHHPACLHNIHHTIYNLIPRYANTKSDHAVAHCCIYT